MARQNGNGTIDLTSDLQYQPAGIVSRILLKQSSGSVTAFAFDQGQELSEHTCPYDALLQVLEGEAEVTVGSDSHRLAAQQTVLLPANVPHAVKAPRQFKMVLTMLRTGAES
jgi:quercetin dioxygenase-like cupin family protein